MNKYLEKLAELSKEGWDGDYETKTHYGVASNRAHVLGKPNINVIKQLRKASLDKDLVVDIHSPKRTSRSTDIKDFHSHLDEIQKEVKEYERTSGQKGMNWLRHHTWGIQMAKDHPKVKAMLGKTDEFTGKPHTANSAIIDMLHKKINI